jgi:hypothetical protein
VKDKNNGAHLALSTPKLLLRGKFLKVSAGDINKLCIFMPATIFSLYFLEQCINIKKILLKGKYKPCKGQQRHPFFKEMFTFELGFQKKIQRMARPFYFFPSNKN